MTLPRGAAKPDPNRGWNGAAEASHHAETPRVSAQLASNLPDPELLNLSPEARAIWDRVAPLFQELVDSGVLKSVDGLILATICRQLVIIEQCTDLRPTIPTADGQGEKGNPALRAQDAATGRLTSALDRCALTPAARHALSFALTGPSDVDPNAAYKTELERIKQERAKEAKKALEAGQLSIIPGADPEVLHA